MDGEDAYVVKMDETTTNYYSTQTGLKLKQVKIAGEGPQSMSIPLVYSNYKEVKGIKFPYTLIQKLPQMTLELNVSDIKVNEGVSEEDFQ